MFFNPNDVRERYCGACHLFQDQVPQVAMVAWGHWQIATKNTTYHINFRSQHIRVDHHHQVRKHPGYVCDVLEVGMVAVGEPMIIHLVVVPGIHTVITTTPVFSIENLDSMPRLA